MNEKQLEFDFSSPYQDVAQELGIRWVPETATPEQIKEWHETDSKWWADRGLSIVAIASVLQFASLGFMLLTMFVVEINLVG